MGHAELVLVENSPLEGGCNPPPALPPTVPRCRRAISEVPSFVYVHPWERPGALNGVPVGQAAANLALMAGTVPDHEMKEEGTAGSGESSRSVTGSGVVGTQRNQFRRLEPSPSTHQRQSAK